MPWKSYVQPWNVKCVVKIISVIALSTLTTACANKLAWVGDAYDRQDPCQTGQGNPQEQARLGRPANYQAPEFCGASAQRKTIRIYDAQHRLIGYVK